MKTLFLLRHAEAEQAIMSSDKARNLTPKGLQDAFDLGVKLKSLDITPQHVLCSPANRTSQTLEQIQKTILCDSIEKPEPLYQASLNTICDLIHKADDSHDSLLVIAHNPGMHQTVVHLAQSISPALEPKVLTSYQPCSLSIIECDTDSWGLLEVCDKKLDQILAPPFSI